MFLLYTIYENALFKGMMYTHQNVILHHSILNENNIALLLSKKYTHNSGGTSQKKL
jgi:hypothetical protein